MEPQALREYGGWEAPILLNALINYVIFNFAKGGQLEAAKLKYTGYDAVRVSETVMVSVVSFCPYSIHCGCKA